MITTSCLAGAARRGGFDKYLTSPEEPASPTAKRSNLKPGIYYLSPLTLFFPKIGRPDYPANAKQVHQTDAPASRFPQLDHYLPRRAQTFTASTSILILISFPTVSPPVSS